MIYNYNKKNISIARILRRNMTKEEKHLWYDFLKNLPITVNRQKNIGNYIVDFFIPRRRIVIEIDGSQHETAVGMKADAKRDSELSQLGIVILRYTNEEVNQHFDAVCEDILRHINL
ncbi:MAG: endonuclease domain-containing protein [Clostridia bacterium]|nr:endonuclease domain-containing protein [Clostridia bacterium]